MLTRSFFFIRHGETAWNLARKLQGHTDIPLNDTGRAQALAACAVLRGQAFDRIVASPLSRARETAEIITAAVGKQISFHEGLRERGFGILEGRAHEEAEQMRRTWASEGRPLEESGYPLPEGGEPYADFQARVVDAINDELSLTPQQSVLFVSHGGVYRVLRRILLGDVEQSPNAAPFLFEKADAGWRLHPL